LRFRNYHAPKDAAPARLARTLVGAFCVEYVDLEKYAAQMQELRTTGKDMKPHRLRSEQSRLMYDMLRILKPSLHRIGARKHMTATLRDEIEQHAAIAITRAIDDWDPAIATFSTYVHWKIMAELQTLQWVEFPDRRKLVLQQPIKFMELDRPIRTGDETGEMSMVDMLEAANGEEDVECVAREYIALHGFERVFSHNIVKQMQAYRINQTDQQKIETKHAGLLRNRWIYICRVIHLETYETIAKRHNITRERIRQVINEIDDDLKGQLPRICKTTKEVIEATRPAPESVHEDWEGMLISFYMETGIDSRLINTDVPLPTRPLDAAEPAITVVVEEVETPAVEDNVVHITARRPQQLSLFKGAGLAMAAGAMLVSAAASAQSRAIPPSAAAAEPVSQPAPAVRPLPGPKAAPTVRTVRPDALQDVAKLVTQRPSWGVQMQNYPKLDALRTAASREQRSWPWLRGLTVAYAGDASTGYRAVFGPLTRDQATGLCHEAKRSERPCNVVGYGTPRA